MTRWIPIAAVTLALTGGAALAEEKTAEAPKAPRKMTEAETKALEKKIVAAINTQAGGVDACVGRYLAEYPEEKGSVALALEVESKGKVSAAKATTTLRGARNLRPCLEGVARAIPFPAPNTDKPVPLSLTVPVQKGAKFKLYAKGEAPKPAPHETPPHLTVQFTNNSWMPRW